MEQKVFIRNRKDLSISINLNISPERKKLVFLEHGLGARKEYPHMKVMEEVFAEHGYNVVNFDATNSLNESDSSPEGVTFTSHFEDLEDVVNWAESQNFYTEPFALAGQSLGAASCINYAGSYSTKTNLLLAASCPFVNGNDLINKDEMMINIEKYGYLDKVSRSVNKTLRINKIFNDDVRTYNLTDKIKNIKAKTYIIQGLLDSEHIIKTANEIFRLLCSEKQLIVLQNTPHDLANTPETKTSFTKVMNSILEKN